jgi:hypothetical protein
MREKRGSGIGAVIFALSAIIVVSAFVAINTAVLSTLIGDIERDAMRVELTEADATELYEKFTHVRTYLSITVNHDDIARVESELAELIGATKAGDRENAMIAKSRLVSALAHLRRLSGFNLDSII